MLRNTDHVSEPATMLKAIKGSLIVCVHVCVCVSQRQRISVTVSAQIKECKGEKNVCVSGVIV